MPACSHCGKTIPQPRYSRGEQKGDEYTRDVEYNCPKPPGCGFTSSVRVIYQGDVDFLAAFAKYQPKREAPKSGMDKSTVSRSVG